MPATTADAEQKPHPGYAECPQPWSERRIRDGVRGLITTKEFPGVNATKWRKNFLLPRCLGISLIYHNHPAELLKHHNKGFH